MAYKSKIGQFRQGKPENATQGEIKSTYKLYAYGFNSERLCLEFSKDAFKYSKKINADKGYEQLKEDFLSGKFCNLSLVKFAVISYADFKGTPVERWTSNTMVFKKVSDAFPPSKSVTPDTPIKKLLTHAVYNFKDAGRDTAMLSMCIILKPEYLKEWRTITRYNFPMFKSVGDDGLRENALSILCSIADQYADIADTALVSNNGTTVPLYRIDLQSGNVYYLGSLQRVLHIV